MSGGIVFFLGLALWAAGVAGNALTHWLSDEPVEKATKRIAPNVAAFGFLMTIIGALWMFVGFLFS
jgi:hypothetical protein